MLNEIKEKFNDLTEGQSSSDNSNQYGSPTNYNSSARYGSSQGQGQGGSNYGSGSNYGGYSRYGSSQSYGSTPRYRSSSDYDYSSSESDYSSSSSNKVWIAALAGASAGLIAGILLAPETGRSTRQSVMRTMGNWGDEIDRTVKSVFGQSEDQGFTRPGSSLQMKGNWNELKGNLKQQYSHLTDDDLNYVEGNEDEFVGNLQRKLGKTKREIYDLLGIDNTRA